MNPKMKLLAIAVVAIIILASITTFNQIVKSKNAPAKIRVACVGDSITRDSGYPEKLQSLLGPNYEVGNFGVDGSTVMLHSQRPYMNQTEFKDALDFQPQIVVIMLGTNDANLNLTCYDSTFEDDYSKLAISFESLETNPQIWVTESPPIQNNSIDLNASVFREKIIPHIVNVSQSLNLPLIDVYDSFENHSDFFMDGVHPDSNGATLIACDVAIAITPNGQAP
jgi:lysophospholipase L1-like esterase